MPQRTPRPAPPAPQQAPPPPPSSRADRRRIRAAARDRRRALAGELRRTAPARRRARLLVAGVLGGVALLVGLPLVLAFAPVFTVARIDVPGATPAVAQAVQAALAAQRGRPIAVVGDADVAAALRGVPVVRSFAVVRRPPDVLEVQVVQRTPVAQQRGGTGWQQVDAARVVIASDTGRYPGLPVVSIGGARQPAAFAAAVAAIEATAAQGLVIDGVRAVSADDVVLTLPGGPVVRWGGAEAGAGKAQALKAALVKAARGVRQIDVSAPGVVLTR